MGQVFVDPIKPRNGEISPSNKPGFGIELNEVVSEMLGHSSVAFILDTYNHVVLGIQKAAARRLDEVLEPELTN